LQENGLTVGNKVVKVSRKYKKDLKERLNSKAD
jgi:hypothetical protein